MPFKDAKNHYCAMMETVQRNFNSRLALSCLAGEKASLCLSSWQKVANRRKVFANCCPGCTRRIGKKWYVLGDSFRGVMTRTKQYFRCSSFVYYETCIWPRRQAKFPSHIKIVEALHFFFFLRRPVPISRKYIYRHLYYPHKSNHESYLRYQMISQYWGL